MTRLLTAVRILAGYLLPGTVSEPRICAVCGRTTSRLTAAQCSYIRANLLPRCMRRGCGGVLWTAGTYDLVRQAEALRAEREAS